MTTNRGSGERYRVLIAVGEPDHLTALLALAVPLARSRGGEVLPLYITQNDAYPDWLEVPEEVQDVVRLPLVSSGRQVGAAILEVIRELGPDLLLLTWRGSPSRERYLLGRTLDPLIQYAPCDVAVLRLGPGIDAAAPAAAFAERMAGPERVLVPSGGGPNASLAVRLALNLGADTRITALRVASANLGPTAVSAEWDNLNDLLRTWNGTDRLRPHVTLATSPLDGILREAGNGYDLVLVGATRESLVDRLLFGNLPQALARSLKVPLLIVKRHDPRPMGALLRARWRLLNVLPQLSLEERIAVYRQVRRNARTDVDFYIMMTLAGAIASLGLLLSSPAVVIGAMLMAPLMSALLGLGLAVVQGDVWLLRLALRTTFLGVLTVLLVSALTALAVPGDRVTAEMLGRSSPTLVDLAVALISGAAAAYAVSREDVASALPGVAIAVALVPPLATVGLAAVSGDARVATGAGLLFLTNLVAIVAAGAILFLWMGFHPDTREQRRTRTFRGGVLATATLFIAVSVVLGLLTVSSIRAATLRSRLEKSLDTQVGRMSPGVTLVDWRLEQAGGSAFELEVTVQATRGITEDEVVALQDQVAAELRRPVSISMTVLPVTRLNAVAPPAAPPPGTSP